MLFFHLTLITNFVTQKRLLAVDQAIEHLGYGKFQVLLMIICGLDQVATSAEVMIISFLMPELKAYWDLTSFQSSMIGVLVFLGKFCGSVCVVVSYCFLTTSSFFGAGCPTRLAVVLVLFLLSF